MDIKELIYQLLEIMEEQGNVDIAVDILKSEHDFVVEERDAGTKYASHVLKVTE